MDVEIMNEAASILRGAHDFKAFTTPSKLLKNASPTYRHVDVTLEPSEGLLANYTPLLGDQFTYWNLVFRSRSFLYKQVRKPIYEVSSSKT